MTAGARAIRSDVAQLGREPDSGRLVEMESGKVVDCSWSISCTRYAVDLVRHLTLGDVPVCAPCKASVTG